MQLNLNQTITSQPDSLSQTKKLPYNSSLLKLARFKPFKLIA